MHQGHRLGDIIPEGTITHCLDMVDVRCVPAHDAACAKVLLSSVEGAVRNL